MAYKSGLLYVFKDDLRVGKVNPCCLRKQERDSVKVGLGIAIVDFPFRGQSFI